MLTRYIRRFALVLPALLLFACSGPSPALHKTPSVRAQVSADTDGDSPLKLVGERLFRETRFSQYFYTHARGDYNQLPAQGDPVVDILPTLGMPIANPYHGQAISCASCHFVDQLKDVPGGGMRAYTDFSRRSPIPDRGDGLHTTPRNAPTMVGSALSGDFFLHHDGEFATAEDLIVASYFGRNLGWEPGESGVAAKHMAQVIRQDNGSFPTETDLGGLAYKKLLAGDPSIPARFLIPPEYRFNVDQASDADIVAGVVKVVAGYMRSLDFSRDPQGHFNGSPFDMFLHKNGLPLAPGPGETAMAYSGRLVTLMNGLTHPRFVTGADGKFQGHVQDFVFGPDEMRGYQIFAGRGRCVQCHAAPDFTDHLFHNTGASQDEYDKIHGAGSFAQLIVPDLASRLAKADLFLPQSDQHPHATGTFRSPPSPDNLGRADLGAWNVFANPDMPHPQARMRLALCQAQHLDCATLNDDQLLQRAIAVIKTPTLRDLGHSAPYLHTGQMDEIEDVLRFYVKTSALARQGLVRNADPELARIQLSADDVNAVAHFLRSLNEDYD